MMAENKLIENMRIESLHKDDLKYVLELYVLLEIDNAKIMNLDKALEVYDKMMAYPDYKIYVAKLDSKIVGTFSLIIMDNITHLGRPSGLIESVVVLERYRSIGIGKKMMEFAIQQCKQANCYKMSLSSNLIRKRAHAFYERLGFKQHGYSFLIDI
jgi:GNAT superfamily N-acetyltransferase